MKASHKASTRLLATLALALACSGIARAGDGSTGCWALRGVIARMETDNRLFLDLGGERRASFLNTGTGLGLSYEHRRGCRWGFEVGLLTAELNSLFIFDSVEPAFWGKEHDDIDFTALTLGPTFHLTRWQRADLYFGPLVALPDFGAGNYVLVNMLDEGPATSPAFRQEFDADLAWGFQAGLDLPLRRGSPWAAHVGVKYLALEVDTGPALAGTLDVDPTIWTAGVSYSPRGCRECEPGDPCASLLRRLDEEGCELCPAGQDCRPEDPCADCQGEECLECTGKTCEELCPPCPAGETCAPDPLGCDDFPADCAVCPDGLECGTCPDGLECGTCPDGLECSGPCTPPTCADLTRLGCRPRPPCPAGLECRPEDPCADCQGLECLECSNQTCEDVCSPRCEECPIPPCVAGQACHPDPLTCADYPAECRPVCPPSTGDLCCLILIGLVSLWLIWWVFRRRRLPMRWFWLWCVPLVFLICKLWFFRTAAAEHAWLLWWLMIALVLTLIFAVLRLLIRKRWIALLLAGVLILVLLVLGQLAAWGWLWWFLLVALALLLIGLLWRSVHDDPHGLGRLILLAVLILVLVLLGSLAAWVWAWKLLLIVLVLTLIVWMAHWLRRRADSGGALDWWLPLIALIAAVIYAGGQAVSGWLWWFLLILVVLAVIYLLRRWIGDRRNTWLALVVLLILILLLLGEWAAGFWLWWFLLIGLILLLLLLLWRRLTGREGPEPPGTWLILIVLLVLVLFVLGGAAGHGWLWWFLLCAVLLPLLWILWRLLGGSAKAACAVLALPLLLLLLFLGRVTSWTWLGWLLLAAAGLLLLYLLARFLGWANDPASRLRLWLCLLALLILALFCLGPLAGWSGHWWLALLVLALALAGVVWRLLGGGRVAGLGQLVWLGLLLIAIVLLILLSAGGGPGWLVMVLTCTLLALLPLAIWALWAHTTAGPPSLGVACAGGLAPLRKFQQGLEPIRKADPGAVRDLFFAYRDQRGWSDMYELYEKMSDELREDLEIRRQLAFALNRDGRDAEAEELLTGLEGENDRSAESWGLLGRIYKDRWDAARKLAATAAGEGGDPDATARGLLDRAIRTYVAGHEAGARENPYPGINALTLAEFDDGWRSELAERLPGELKAALDAAEPAEDSDYWHHATRLELAIHQDREGDARQALARALAASRPSPSACPQVWKVETTCRNLRLLEEGRSRHDQPLPAWAGEVVEELEESCGGGEAGPSECGDDPGSTLQRYFGLRDRQAWTGMHAMVQAMPPDLGASSVVRQQQAFALNREGRDRDAEEILTALLDEQGPSAETCGLLGRIHKDRWDAARKVGRDAVAAEELERAITAYLEGHETGERNPYPGINALTLAEFSEARRGELRGRLLEELAGFLDATGATGYWHHATRLELAVHQRSEGAAREALRLAVQAAGEAGDAGAWMVETTSRNLRLLEEAGRERGEPAPAWLGAAIAELERA